MQSLHRLDDSSFCLRDAIADPVVDEKQRHFTTADNCIQLMSQLLKRDICNFWSAGTLVKDIDLTDCLTPFWRRE